MTQGLLRIYVEDKDGNVVGFPLNEEQAVVKDWTRTAERMAGSPSVTGTVMYKLCLDNLWTKKEFVIIGGERYYVKQVPTSSKDTEDVRYKHDVTLVSERDILENVYFFDVVTKREDAQASDKPRSNTTVFSFFGDLKELVGRLNDSLSYSKIYDAKGVNGFCIVIDEDVEIGEAQEVSITDAYFATAMQEIYNVFKVPYYWVGKICHVGYAQNEISTPFEYGKDNGLLSVSKNNSEYRLINRITGMGSADNIPYYYPNTDPNGEPILTIKNMDRANIKSIQLTTINAKFGGSVGKTFCLGNIKEENATTELYNDDKTLNGIAKYAAPYLDDDSGTEGYIDEDPVDSQEEQLPMILEFEFYAYVNDKIDMSGLTINTSYQISGATTTIAFNKGSQPYWGQTCTPTPIENWEARVSVILPEGIEDPDGPITANDKTYRCKKQGVHKLIINCTPSYRVSMHPASKPDELAWATIDWYCHIKGAIKFKTFYGDVIYENGRVFKLSESGISIIGNDLPKLDIVLQPSQDYGSFDGHIIGGSIATCAQFTITGIDFINPISKLMPYVYREQKGAERFYNALNEKYLKENGEYYSFNNPYLPNEPLEGKQDFEDIKPTINGITNAQGQLFGEVADIAFDETDSDDLAIKDGDSNTANLVHSYFYIKLNKFDGDYGFNLFKQGLSKGAMTLNFITGSCAGCAFEVGVSKPSQVDNHYEFENPIQVDESGNIVAGDYDDKVKEGNPIKSQQDTTANEVWIVLKKDQSTFGVVMPNATNDYKPKAGDKFVITNILLPQVYITAAEKRLEAALIKYMSENNDEKFTFSIKFSRIYLQKHIEDIVPYLNENARINVKYNNTIYPLYVSSYTQKYDGNILDEISVELSEELTITQNKSKQQMDSILGNVNEQINSALKDNNNNSQQGVTDSDLVAIKNLLNNKLSKVTSDTAAGIITFLQGTNWGNFTSETGAAMTVDPSTGQTYMEVDRLKVRLKAFFEQLEVQKVGYVGGKLVVTPGQGVDILDVEEVYDTDGNLTAYRCYFLGEQEGRKIDNLLRVKDQMICKDFNVSEGSTDGATNKYYWRLATAVSSDVVKRGNNVCHWVDLSATDCDTNSDVPSVGDTICHLGNREDTDRQGAEVLSVVDANSPSFTIYSGINSYSLVNKEYIDMGVSGGKAFCNIYGSTYIGDRNRENGYISWDYDKEENVWKMRVKGTIDITSQLSSGGTIGGAIDDAANAYKGEFNNFVNNTYAEDKKDFYNQLDGKVETWYQTEDPKNKWSAADYSKHKGDIWYDDSMNKSYRWTGTAWVELKDQAAIDAKALAESKRRVFTTTTLPTPPYDAKDLWVQGENGDIMVCVTPKAAGATASASDWEKASKYTDDTKANEALAKVGDLQTDVTELGDSFKTLTDFTLPALSDGIITTSEKENIRQALMQVQKECVDVINAYTNLTVNYKSIYDKIAADVRTNFATAYTNLMGSATLSSDGTITYTSGQGGAYGALVDNINTLLNKEGNLTTNEIATINNNIANFNIKYNDFQNRLVVVRNDIEKTLDKRITDVDEQLGGYAYLKKIVGGKTTIDGGLVLTTMLGTGYEVTGGAYKIMSGISGLYEKPTSVAIWAGGSMVDKFVYYDAESGKFNVPDDVNPANFLVRMDGTGYAAGGNFWWDNDGKIHADPQSFLINEQYVGNVMQLFQLHYREAGKTDFTNVDYVTPTRMFNGLELSDKGLQIGDTTKLYIKNGVLFIEGDLAVTGGITMYASDGVKSGMIDQVYAVLDQSLFSIVDGAITITGEIGSGTVKGIAIKGTQYDPDTNGIIALTLNWSDLTGVPTTFTPSAHNHNDLYYTETEIDTKLAGKSNTGHTHDDRYYIKSEIDTKLGLKLDTSLKGAANGLATLDSSGKVPSSQLPSYVDDVLECANKASFPTTGEGGKIYIDQTTNLTYRWGGTAYVEISQSLALGETSSTAYAGDKGKQNAADIAALKTGKADKATTLSGYGITDAYTKTEVNTKLTDGSVTKIGTKDVGSVTLPIYLKAGVPTAVGTSLAVDITGNSATTSKLKTAVTLWGQSFDGSKAITGNLTNVGTITPTGEDLKVVGNLIVTGGIVMYADDGATIESGFAALLAAHIDGVTIKQNNQGKIYSVMSGIAVNGTTYKPNETTGIITIPNYPTSLDWEKIDNKPDTFTPSSHTHTFASLTSKPTTLSGYGITDAKIVNGVITLGTATITPLTAHQTVTLASGTNNGTLKLTVGSKTTDNIAVKGLGSAAYTASSAYAAASHTHSYLPLAGGTMTGGITFSNSSHLQWNSGSYHQRIFLTDDSTADTAVFTFQQSTDSGTNWSNLMVIRDNGKVIANTFVGALSGNASTATKWATARKITLTGSVTGEVSIDGSGNVTLATTTNHTHSYVPLSGGTMSGNLILKGGTSADMTYAGNVHPSIRFDNSDSSQNVSLIFTDYDSYRAPAGIKLVGSQGNEWFEAANIYATTFHGALSGNAATATTASKLGTANVGSGTQHFYLSGGTATASTSTVGGTAKPMYLRAGVMTAISDTVGGTAKPIFLNAGTLTAISATVGSASKPVYLNGGSVTACSYDFTSYLPLAGGTMAAGARISHADGNMYIGRSDNNGWVMCQDMCSQSGSTYWKLMTNGTFHSTVAVVSGNTSVGSLTINGINVTKSSDGILKIDGNLIVTGGITMYATDGVASGLMEQILVDGTTIGKKADGTLYAINTGNVRSIIMGSTTYTPNDSGAVTLPEKVTWANIEGKPSTFAPSSHTHAISQITNLQTTLDGKAAASHTHSYLPLSGGTISGRLLVNYNVGSSTPAIAINFYDNYTIVDNSIAQIKMGTPKYDAYLGLSPAAKGYYGKVGYFMHIGTDYEFLWATSNWTKRMALECSSGNLWVSGSVTATGFVKSGSSDSYVLLGGGGHKAVSDFATSSHTHNYLPLSGGTMSGYISAPGKGIIFYGSVGATTGAYITGSSEGVYINGYKYVTLESASVNYHPRVRLNTVDYPLLSTYNYNSYVPTLTGTGASGTWGISISGNAAMATNADTVDGYHASSFLIDRGGAYTGLIYDLPCKSIFSGFDLTDAPVAGWVSGLILGSNWNSNHYQHYLVEAGSRWYATRAGSNGKMVNWNTFAYLTDNVASATKLQTARTIWGQSFDGTGDIPISVTAKMPFVFFKRFDNDENAGYIGCGSSSNNNIYITSYVNSNIILDGNNIGIGTYNPSEKLQVNGNIYSTGDVKIGGAIRDASNNWLLGGTADGTTSLGSANFAGIREIVNRNGKLALNANGDTIISTSSKFGIAYANSTEIYNYFEGGSKLQLHVGGWTSNRSNEYVFRILAFNGGANEIPSLAIAFNGNVGINNSYPEERLSVGGNILATGGFKKNGSSDSYVLLGGGGHSKITDLSVSNADTVDGYHANGLLTALSNSDKGISITVGGTTKSVSNISVNYASSAGNADTLDGYHWDSFPTAGAYNSGDFSNFYDRSFIGSINASAASSPTGSQIWFNTVQIAHRNGGGDGAGYISQIAIGMTGYTDRMWFRGSRGGSWTSVITSANIGSQSVSYATSASKWKTARKITLTGSVTGSVSIDGSGDVTLATTTNHTHSYLPLAGGTMTGQIQRAGQGSSWIKGRDNAMIRVNSKNGYSVLSSIKTTNGSWEIGHYDASGYYNNLLFGYYTDDAYSANNNSGQIKITFTSDGQVTATQFNGALNGNASTATNADKLDGEHSSAFAHIGAHNNLMAAGNEFTFASSGFTGEVFINYRTAGGTNGNISKYTLFDGAGHSLGTIIHTGNYSSYALPLSGGTMTAGARISHADGNMYLGRADNNGWLMCQDMCSQTASGDTYWSLRTNGTFHALTTCIGGHLWLNKQNASSSTGGASQLVFGLDGNQHVVISSNKGAVIINPSTSSSTGQLILRTGTSSTSEFAGNIKAGGGITMYSDLRKKNVLSNEVLSVKEIALAPLFAHTYKSDDNQYIHVGTSAQYWSAIHEDWFTRKDSEGYYQMELQNLGVAMGISLAREIVTFEGAFKKYESKTDKKIRLMKKKINELEKANESLEARVKELEERRTA